MFALIVIVIVLVALTTWLAHLDTERVMKVYWSRSCTGRAWRREFPERSSDDIREFLRVFTDAFGFADKRRLNFSPADRVYDVYRTLYPSLNVADGMENETFVLALEKRYGISVPDNWFESCATLGDLFRLTQSSSSPQHSKL